MSHSKSYRTFIILQEDEKGHSIASDKPLTGYAKIETKNDKCKVSFYAQNLKQEYKDCYMMLVCNNKDFKKNINLGPMNINQQGKAEMSLEYDSINIGDLNVSYENIVGAAIGKNINGRTVFFMCGFLNNQMPKDNWRNYEVKMVEGKGKSHHNKDNKEEEKKKEYISNFNEDKDKKDKEKQDKYKEFLKEKDEEYLKKEDKEKNEKNDCKEKVKEEKKDKKQDKEDNHKKEDNKKKEDNNKKEDKDKEKSDKSNKDKQEKAKDDKNKDKHEENKGENCSKKQNRDDIDCELKQKDYDVDATLNEECKISREESSKENNDLGKRFLEYEDEIEDIKIRNCKEKEEKTYEVDFDCPIGEVLMGALDGCKKVPRFAEDIKRCAWYRVDVNNFDDMCNMSNYNKYTMLYYPMINYYPYISKEGHFFFGIKCDKNGDIKYILYAIPGTKNRKDQPYAGRTGFVTWDRCKDSENGYWIMFYDFENSSVVIPMK